MWPESKEAYENALRYKPDLVPALHGLASLLRGMNKTEEAISYFKKALQLDPNHNRAFAELACLYDLTCYWPGYTEREKKLHLLSKASIAKEQPPPIDALSMIYRDWPAQEILTLMGNFGRFSLEQLPTYQKQVNFTFTKTAKKRLRIGYLSSDFTNHPVAHLTNNLYAHHNREQFEVVGFYLGDDTSSVYYKHIAASCDKFISLFNAKDVEGAKKIYAENIDILIDLNGYTKGCRSYMLALKPAPIQAHYLGFLAPMAAPYIDYVIADEWVIPPTTAAIGYSEKPVYLPYYQVYDNKTEISDKPLQRKDYDLPEDKFVYCCFNNTYKIQPQIFAVWMKILAQAPNSVLWLLKTSDLVKHNLFEAAKAHGIDTARLIFAGYEERSLYLARYRLADLFLDTPFYNANTTGSDALWAGLPLLTYPTPNFAGRGASSALRALGVPELIASDLKNYQEIALHFYNNPEALAQIRAKMAAQRDTSQLFDMQNTIRHLEKGYQTMWEIYLRGETPRPIKTY
jgi:predicted O-linked N-acetylglucosamine transferase (SPINDLY family)